MYVALFLFTSLLALAFILINKKIKINWIKKTFVFYAFIYTITALALGTFYIMDNKAVIKSAMTDMRTNISRSFEVQRVPTNDTLTSDYSVKSEVQLDAPLVTQLPELPRGCEVTTLAMLLQYHDISIDKMELANKVKKDTSPYQVTETGISFGNPHHGFVGDMYSFSEPGLGVYHQPIAELAAEYTDDKVHDFTGESFGKVFEQLNKERPVWVIINATYEALSDDMFTTWHTSDGPIEITMKEHSVLITGYDEAYIYFNDPLNRDEKAPIDDFKAAWEQMGKQAITIY